MVTYTVHEAPNPSADRVDRADELRFVKDGFSWLTAFIPPLGLAAKGLWLPLLAYIIAMTLLGLLLHAIGTAPQWISLAIMAISLYLGFEVSSLERFMLDRAGWRMLGSVTGRNIGECERRFFETWLPDQPVIRVTRNHPDASDGSLPFGAKA
ncbi:MAG: DUF2628 domain-containing protein [Hyphomicrobiaceae bacterium]